LEGNRQKESWESLDDGKEEIKEKLKLKLKKKKSKVGVEMEKGEVRKFFGQKLVM